MTKPGLTPQLLCPLGQTLALPLLPWPCPPRRVQPATPRTQPATRNARHRPSAVHTTHTPRPRTHCPWPAQPGPPPWRGAPAGRWGRGTGHTTPGLPVGKPSLSSLTASVRLKSTHFSPPRTACDETHQQAWPTQRGRGDRTYAVVNKHSGILRELSHQRILARIIRLPGGCTSCWGAGARNHRLRRKAIASHSACASHNPSRCICSDSSTPETT